MKISPAQMLVLDGKILLYAQRVGMIGGKTKCYADGWYIGEIGENGKLTNVRWLDAAQE